MYYISEIETKQAPQHNKNMPHKVETHSQARKRERKCPFSIMDAESLSAGCLTVLGITARDHVVGFDREQTLANGDFQLSQKRMSAPRKFIAESGREFW